MVTRRAIAGRAKWIGALLVLLVPSMSSATGLESSLTFFSVKFRPGDLALEPHGKEGKVCLLSADKSQTLLDVLSPVAVLEPVHRRGTPNFAPAGPWRVGLMNVTNPESLLVVIRADEHVEYAELVTPGDNAVLSDRASTMFPPIDDKPDLCNYQTQLHARRDGEPRFPDETCDAVVDSWNHDCDMDLPQAWAITQGDSNVLVAVVDIGTAWTHPGMGGTGPAQSVPDSLPYYNDGAIFRNWTEQLGDANSDGYPGVQGIDDDGDGLIDEDSMGREPGNTSEADVTTGTVTAVQDTTITDSGASWVVNEHVGQYLYGNTDLTFYAEIVSNTATSVTARAVTIDAFRIPWSVLTQPGMGYKIGNLIDDDNDGQIDDPGYLGDLFDDDDENGYIDDLHGYDFLDLPGVTDLPNEDYEGEDNDPRSVGGHGTAVASQVATAADAPMMGIAPGVKILPIRGGYQHSDPVNLCGVGAWNEAGYSAGMAYARLMDADFIVTASGGAGPSMIEQGNLAARDGILHFNGTSGGLENIPHPFSQCDSTVIVGGLSPVDEAVGDGFGSWVEVSSRSRDLRVAEHRTSCPLPPVDTYGVESGTSLSGPIVAGVAALIKSAYPHWTLDDIRNKLLTSVDNIYQIPEDPDLNENYLGLLGTGRVNAYKALTFYGKVGSVSTDTTWTGKVWVSGDIEIPEGSTLHIAPGTRIFMAQDDILDKGISANRCEIVVKGSVSFEGTESDSIVIDMLRDPGSTNTWGPFVFENASAKTHGVFEHVVFRNAYQIAKKGDLPLQHRVGLSFVNCTMDTFTTGIEMRGLGLGDSLVVSGCRFRGVIQETGVGVLAEGATGFSDYVVRIGDDSHFSNLCIGVSLQTHSVGQVTECTMDSCGTGVWGLGLDGSGPVIGPDVAVTASYGAGMYLSYGAPVVKGCTVADAGSYGIEVGGTTRPVFESPTTTIEGSGLHGVYAHECASNAIFTDLSIAGSGNSGIRLLDCSPTISGPVEIGTSASAAVYCDGASPLIQDVEMTSNVVGLIATNTSNPTMRDCTIADGMNGVIAESTDMPDIGLVNDFGGNAFNNISGYYGINFNVNAVLMMIGNCYNGSTTPRATKFGGSNITSYSPGDCQ
ncbi:MAG: S8 family serine peptidase [Candidatus Krumholzibacteriia bacterium]